MKTATQRTPENHAELNARGWYETIAGLVGAMNLDYDRLEELRDERAALVADCEDPECTPALTERNLADWDTENGEELAALTLACTVDGETYGNADDVRERIQECPLSVEIRSGWYTPGGDNSPEEFSILLSTGGPALRLRGDLDEYKQPCRAWLEYQDWGTPWTQFFGADQDTLLAFASVFYYGD